MNAILICHFNVLTFSNKTCYKLCTPVNSKISYSVSAQELLLSCLLKKHLKLNKCKIITSRNFEYLALYKLLSCQTFQSFKLVFRTQKLEHLSLVCHQRHEDTTVWQKTTTTTLHINILHAANMVLNFLCLCHCSQLQKNILWKEPLLWCPTICENE